MKKVKKKKKTINDAKELIHTQPVFCFQIIGGEKLDKIQNHDR